MCRNAFIFFLILCFPIFSSGINFFEKLDVNRIKHVFTYVHFIEDIHISSISNLSIESNPVKEQPLTIEIADLEQGSSPYQEDKPKENRNGPLLVILLWVLTILFLFMSLILLRSYLFKLKAHKALLLKNAELQERIKYWEEKWQDINKEQERSQTDQSNIIKELKQAKDDAVKAAEMKTMSLASLSHEIRTPLSSIIGITGVLEETKLSQEQKEYLNVISISGNNLMSLINNILDFSKLEAGELQMEKVDFNLEDALNEVTTLLRIKANDTRNKLITSVDEQIPKKLRGDVIRLKQILINLINNALKFTKEGTVSIQALLFDHNEDTIRVKFNIVDTGLGVAVQQRDRLFTDFSQADSSITRKYGGTGLGLAISKRFTTMMGGEMGVQSEIGKGSNFWFTILFDKAGTSYMRKQEDHLPPIDHEVGKTGAKKLNILLVEDNFLNQKFAQAILKKQNHVVDIAENGRIGVEMFQKNTYDIILMDIQMPEMDGLEATRKIREIERKESRKPIRIVAVTAYAMEGDEKEYYSAGIDDYLRKPYKSNQLLQKLTL